MRRFRIRVLVGDRVTTPVSHNWIVERCGRMLVARDAHFNEVDGLVAQSW